MKADIFQQLGIGVTTVTTFLMKSIMCVCVHIRARARKETFTPKKVVTVVTPLIGGAT